MNTCFEIVTKKTETFLPTHIRLDISHWVAIVCRWTCNKKHPFAKVRQFFIRSICHAYQMDNMQDIEYFLESVLVVALSHSFTSDSSALPLSQTRFEYVNSIIKGMSVCKTDDNDKGIEESEDKETEDKDEKHFKQRSEAWVMWSTKIYEQATNIASQCCDGETLNAYYNIEVAKNIKRLMCFLPLWTGIMIPFFGTKHRIATSSSVESEFANIKTRAFKSELPQRVDKFVFHHIDYLDGRIKEASTKLTVSKTEFIEKNYSKDVLQNTLNENTSIDGNSKINIEKKSSCDKHVLTDTNISQVDFPSNLSLQSNDICTTSNNVQDPNMEDMDVFEESMKMDEAIGDENVEKVDKFNLELNNPLNAGENWRGKITPDKKNTKRSTYLDPFPNWDFVQSHKFVDIPLLRNGNLCDSVKLKNNYICIRNTCAFDSFVQMLARAIGKEKVYKSCIQDHQSLVLRLARNILTRGKIMANDYKIRAEILQELVLCNISGTRQIKMVDATCNIAHLIEILLTDLPSVTRFTKCSKCNYTESRNLSTLCINVEILLTKGFNCIQEAIDDTEKLQVNRTLCKQCGGNLERTHEYGPHIFLDTSVITDPHYNQYKQDMLCKQTLDSLTKLITLEENSYTICGIVDYKEDKSHLKLSHYTAILYTGFVWHEYDDLMKKKTNVKSQKNTTTYYNVRTK